MLDSYKGRLHSLNNSENPVDLAWCRSMSNLGQSILTGSYKTILQMLATFYKVTRCYHQPFLNEIFKYTEQHQSTLISTNNQCVGEGTVEKTN